jgi:hypothetical protein
MADRMTRKLTAICAATALLIVIGGSVGLATGALKTKRAETSVGEDLFESATATCKKGTRVVSGGFDAPGSEAAGDTPRNLAFLSERTGKRGWTAGARNVETEAGDWIVFAHCSDSLPKLKAKTATVTVPGDEAETATAKCPKGGEAVSGGFVAQDEATDDDPFPYESRRVGKRKWEVGARNFRPDPVQLTAIAYCAKKKLGLKAASTTVTHTVTDENVEGEARCKKKTKVVSGGFDGELTANFERETYPFQSMRTGGRTWSAAAYGYLDGDPAVDWEVFAYCIDKKELR